MTLAVNQRSQEVEALAQDWPMLEALMAGTRAMREQGTALLPKMPQEGSENYRARLAVSTLYPAYRRTVSVMSGKPFSQPVAMEIPARLASLADDIDMQGCNLHVFLAEMFQEALAFGLAGILIDYPSVPVGQPRTVAQVEAQGLRPYWVRVKHNQILGWRTSTRNGKTVLDQLRLLEAYDEPDGPYGVETREQVRVLTPGGWEIWRQASGTKQEWVLHDSGATTLDYVPFVPLYGRRAAFMQGVPPLIDLAFLNVKHWQSQSDQDNIERLVRVPILKARCVGDDFTIIVGASSAVNLGHDPNADVWYETPDGGGASIGSEALIALRDQMIETGAELLVRRQSGAVTATEAGNDAEANKSDLQRIAEAFEDAADQALWITADYLRLPEGGTIKLFDDYGAATLSDASAQLIVTLQQGGLLSKETAIGELKRRGVLAETVDAGDEAERVAADGPALGELGAEDEGGE